MIDIESIFNVVKESNKEFPSFMIYTGRTGMQVFDFTLRLAHSEVLGYIDSKFKYWIDQTNWSRRKNPGFLYIHLVERHGLYKLRFYPNKKYHLWLMKGTECILQTNNFKDINNHLYDL